MDRVYQWPRADMIQGKYVESVSLKQRALLHWRLCYIMLLVRDTGWYCLIKAEVACLQVHDGERICCREAEQTQYLEHLDCGHERGAALLDDVSAGHDVALLGCEGWRHACIPWLHHWSLPIQPPFLPSAYWKLLRLQEGFLHTTASLLCICRRLLAALGSSPARTTVLV